MARAGRKRKIGDRTPAGRIKARPEPIVPVFALRRRADLVGGEYAYQPEAQYALGQLQLLGIIVRRQHDAGLALRTAWMRWASIAGGPPHQISQRNAGIQRPGVDPELWAKARRQLEAAIDAVQACQAAQLVRAAVECVVMDDVLPPAFRDRAQAVRALQLRLDALADHFGFPGGQDTKAR
jgi:hypothetical protein